MSNLSFGSYSFNVYYLSFPLTYLSFIVLCFVLLCCYLSLEHFFYSLSPPILRYSELTIVCFISSLLFLFALKKVYHQAVKLFRISRSDGPVSPNFIQIQYFVRIPFRSMFQ